MNDQIGHSQRELYTNAFRKASQFFFRLLESGRILRAQEHELCRPLDDEDVQECLKILEEEGNVRILFTPTQIFLSPGLDNRFLGFSNEELRKRLHVLTNDELALAHFAILSLLSLFYRAEGFDGRSRDFIEIEEWERFLTEKLIGIRDSGSEAALNDSVKLNLAGILKVWERLIPYDETIQRLAAATNNRMSFLARVLAFLADEDLVNIDQNRIILPTHRLDAVMNDLTTSEARRKELAVYFSSGASSCR
jgi:hypothetical protein